MNATMLHLPMLIAPLISVVLNTGADNTFPHFTCAIGRLQIIILKNPQLLIYYVRVCQHNFDVMVSSSY